MNLVERISIVGGAEDNMEIDEKRYYHIFPFGKVKSGSEVIIWGAGEVGREYVQQLERTGYCSVRYIVDSNWANMAKREKTVYPPEKLAEETASTVVIAIADVKTAMKIIERIGTLCPKANVIYEDQMCHISEIKNRKSAFSELSDFMKGQKEIIQSIPSMNGLISLMNREIISIESSLKYLNPKIVNQGRWDEYCLEIRKLLRIYGVDGHPLVRVGGRHDGGYIMLDDFNEVRVAYSFGISNDVTWDKDIANRSIDIFMYDHTIQRLPEQDKHFHFFRKGVAEMDRPDGGLYSMKTFLHENGHEKETNMILKMDIEGAEWDVLEKVESSILKMFGQVILEFHGMTVMDHAQKVKNVLTKLNMSHAVVHVHGNNYGIGLSYKHGVMPEALEVTYVNREVYKVKETNDVDLPIILDERCNCERDEFCLGKWNKV